MPPILSTRHCQCNDTRSCSHAQKTIPLAPIHPFTKQMVRTFIVPRIVDPKLIQIVFTCFSYEALFLCVRGFFLFVSLFHFHCTLFSWVVGACVNPAPFVLSLVCQITYSFLNGFQPNLYQHFSNVYSTCHTIFSQT